MIAHVLDFRGDIENVDVVLRPAGYAHFFFLMPLKKLLGLEQKKERRDLGLLTKLCSKAEELDHKSPDTPVYMRAKEMLENF